MTTQQLPHKARLFVISAPSGAGKTSLVKAALDKLDNLQVSISHTTRKKRPAEIDGVHYHFIDDHHFMSMIQNDLFLEHANVFDFQYGTSKQWVTEALEKGIDVILEIDWQGAQKIAQQVDCTSVFILPPSIQVLKQRLNNRSQDSTDTIARRMRDAKAEIAHFGDADYVIINDDFDQALAELSSIIQAERLRTGRQKHTMAALVDQLLQ